MVESKRTVDVVVRRGTHQTSTPYGSTRILWGHPELRFLNESSQRSFQDNAEVLAEAFHDPE
jgi:hypothetical protein